MAKPLTKALHTTRIIECVARHIVAKHQGARMTPGQLYSAALAIIDNEPSMVAELNAACLAVCKSVLEG